MKTTKKLLTLALAAMLLLSLAVPAMADDSDFWIDEYGNLSEYYGPGGDIVIPDGVTSIEHEGFPICRSNSDKVTGITIPEGVNWIGTCVFSELKNLVRVSIPSSVTYMGVGAFQLCTALKSVTISAGVTSLGTRTFTGCTSLTDIYFGGTQAQWEALQFTEGGAPARLFDLELYGSGGVISPTIHYNSTGPDDTTTPETPTTPTTPSFTDVPANAWYAAPVAWAVEKEITNGTGNNKFSPEKTCNNAEILTFLWRACGKPDAPAANFTDVASGVWYADAANWAKSKGMVSGSTLSPTEPCTRASAVMFIWQAMGKPAASKTASFSDVPANADYAAAVAWAVEKGVTNGTGNNTFSPDTICTRGHIVTFLQRACA